MAEENASVPVVRNEADEQFEATIGGHTGTLTYSEGDGKLYLLHTEVPEELEGHGLGSLLVRAGVDYAREKHLTIIPFCPFARAYLHRHHADYGDLVDFG